MAHVSWASRPQNYRTYEKEIKKMKTIANKIKPFKSSEELLNEIAQLSKQPGVKVISFANAHAINLAYENPQFELAILESSLLLRDGIGVKIMLKTFNLDAGYNSNGTDLMPKVINRAASQRVMLIGSNKETVESAANLLIADGINIISYMDGFNTFEEMLAAIHEQKPELLVLGMGMPKQEIFSNYLKDNCSHNLLVINAGAVFDFIAQKVSRAPSFMQKYGLEWLFRLSQEPKRLFRRYVIGIPLFFLRLIHSRIGY